MTPRYSQTEHFNFTSLCGAIWRSPVIYTNGDFTSLCGAIWRSLIMYKWWSYQLLWSHLEESYYVQMLILPACVEPSGAFLQMLILPACVEPSGGVLLSTNGDLTSLCGAIWRNLVMPVHTHSQSLQEIFIVQQSSVVKIISLVQSEISKCFV